jgi:hypothetical protein
MKNYTALASCTRSSPGLDEIHYDFIKQMNGPERMKLLGVYNKIWKTGDFPTGWTEATVIPILKPGKDPNEPKSYHPISLTSCICKVMEENVNRRLQYIIESRKLLPETQFGFRRNKSTTDVLITLENFIMDAIRKKEYTALLSLDISKAYDTCWRFGVLRKLKQWILHGRILKFISDFMSNRKLKVAVGNHYSTPTSIENGVVQGAVLSVTLFFVAMTDIVKDIKEPTQIMGYADDWVISVVQF